MKANGFWIGIACLLSLAVLWACGGKLTSSTANCAPFTSTAAPGNSTTIRVWATSGSLSGCTVTQADRIGKPFVNPLFSTVANGQHQATDTSTPTSDSAQLMVYMDSFLSTASQRSLAVRQAVESLLVPDVLIVNLTANGSAGYLGVETHGQLGHPFGGRDLSDDVVDTNLELAFGDTVVNLNLATDDGNEISTLTSDGVGPGGKNLLAAFPYLGTPL